MAYATINQPNEHFATNAYTGQGGSRNVTDTDNVNFTPDLVWIKHRQDAASHTWFDSVRGVGKYLASDATTAEATNAQSLTAFIDGGFSVGTSPDSPRTDEAGGTPNHVAWMWKAGGTAVSNTDGSVTSSVSANTSAGFSIFSFTATGSAQTVGHGLGGKPDAIIFKGKNTTSAWPMYLDPYNDDTLQISDLQQGNASAGDSPFTWDSSVFTWTSASSYSNTASTQYIAYAFRSIKGYSKIGRYTGNGNADGPFVYTGFKPAFILIKNISEGSSFWKIYDTKRDTFNTTYKYVNANTTSADNSNAANNNLDILSNGFKIRYQDTGADTNKSNNDYIYLSFAEAPLVGTNNIPATAR